MDPRETNEKLLAEVDFTDAQKKLLLKTSATFSRTELRELEALLQDKGASSFVYQDMAYHR